MSDTNSKVVDVYNELVNLGLKVDMYDPHANKADIEKILI